MARFKAVNMSLRFLPVVLEQQLVPGTFEYALHTLIDTEFDLSALAANFRNDETGAPGYDPAVMLKIVLLAYWRGMVSSRAIERACAENVLFMAVSGDTQPAYTTIAAFGHRQRRDSGLYGSCHRGRQLPDHRCRAGPRLGLRAKPAGADD